MHLPGFPDGEWPVLEDEVEGKKGDTAVSKLVVDKPGIRIFRTTVPLHIPNDMDVSISFKFLVPSGESNRLRALLFVNGYQYGRYNPYIGNQVVFLVPPGVLDYDGMNTVVVTVWNQNEEGRSVEMGVDWVVEYVHLSKGSGYDVGRVGEGLRGVWTRDRERFA